MYYIIYRIINIINGKEYTGKHVTNNINDRYMGSGELIILAIKKYGFKNFKKEILFVFDNDIDMNNKESEIVTEDYCNRSDTYNICIGGFGGYSFAGKLGRKQADITLQKQYGDNWRSKLSHQTKEKSRKTFKERLKNDPKLLEEIRNGLKKGREKALLPEFKEKRRKTFKKINHQQGEKNSQYGTCWITNGIDNKKISKKDLDKKFLYAIKFKLINQIDLLIKAGANVNIKNSEGETPLKYALSISFHRDDIIDLLKKYGAKE